MEKLQCGLLNIVKNYKRKFETPECLLIECLLTYKTPEKQKLMINFPSQKRDVSETGTDVTIPRGRDSR